MTFIATPSEKIHKKSSVCVLKFLLVVLCPHVFIPGLFFSGMYLFRGLFIQGFFYSGIYLFKNICIQGCIYSGLYLFRGLVIQGCLILACVVTLLLVSVVFVLACTATAFPLLRRISAKARDILGIV